MGNVAFGDLEGVYGIANTFIAEGNIDVSSVVWPAPLRADGTSKDFANWW